MECVSMWRSLGQLLAGLFSAIAMAPANPLAQFRTVFGTIEVELLKDQRPVTVSNFIHYVESGRYEGTFIHRLVPNLLVAGGCYAGINRQTDAANYTPIPHFNAITNETRMGGILTNLMGTLSLGGVSNTNVPLTSEFFFSLTDSQGAFFTQNQGGYPVFGRVRGGLEVLQALNKFQVLHEVRRATNALITIRDVDLPGYLYGTAQFPVLTFDPTFDVEQQVESLVYLDITLLNVSVVPLFPGARIEWDSVPGRTNVVEFTRAIPPTWETLARLAGTGGRMGVKDKSSDDHRFHRVRIEY